MSTARPARPAAAPATPPATPPATRNPTRTRRAVLDAAARGLVREGSGLSLATVARDAGVSKSGLLHHFGSRDALLHAVAVDSVEAFRAQVLAQVDLSENHAGQLLRAYVRAMCDAVLDDEAATADHLVLWTTLRDHPGVAALVEHDLDRWETDLLADGADPDRVLVVRLAAEGLAAVAAQSVPHARRLVPRVRELLTGLSTGWPAR